MRILVLAALPAILFGHGGAPVEGVVIDSATQRGIAGVGVSVVSTSAQHRVTYTTTTDSEGAFRIGSIDQDGEYKAEFVKRGFREAPARPFTLAAATGPVRLHVELAPHPQLRGRVVDAAGHPVSEASVQMLGAGSNWVLDAPVGKDGVFVYQDSLPSSAFFLRAVADPKLPPPESTKDETVVWAPTYSPSGTDRSQAVRVVWRGDRDLDGYEIRLQAVPVFHVRGVVVDDTGKPVAGAAVKLLPAEILVGVLQPVQLKPEAQTVTPAEGIFEFPSVRAGDWQLAAEWKRGDRTLSGFAAGRMSHTDWENVRVALGTPFAVSGVAEVPEGGDPQSRSVIGAVMLVPADGSAAPRPAPSVYEQDGSFEIRDVLPGRYRIQLTELEEDSGYLDSVRFGGREVLGQTVDLMDGSLPIRVIYKANGGRVQGTAEHCGAAVVFPKDAALHVSIWSQIGQFIRVGKCDSAGKFQIGRLRPGDYYAAAFDRLPEDAMMDQAFVVGLVGSGESVRVEAGQSTTVTLKAMPWPEQ